LLPSLASSYFRLVSSLTAMSALAPIPATMPQSCADPRHKFQRAHLSLHGHGPP
jgi:hypothetical protein